MVWFLRSSEGSYLAPTIFMSVLHKYVVLTSEQVTRFALVQFVHLKKASVILPLLKVNHINYDSPENARNKILFENLTLLFPTERLVLELGNGSTGRFNRPCH